MKGKPRRLDFEREVAKFWDKNLDLTAQEVGERFEIYDKTVSKYYQRYWGESFSVRKKRANAAICGDPSRKRADYVRKGNDPEFVKSVAEFLHDHPEMTTDEVGEKFGCSGKSAREYFIRFYKISLNPFRKRFQEKRDAEIR